MTNYKCSACGREFTEDEANGNIVFSIPDRDVCLCVDCTQKALRETLRHQQIDTNVANMQNMNDNAIASMYQEAKEVSSFKNECMRMKKVIASTSPVEIKHHLDHHIIGQENAKKILSVAAYNHYKRIMYSMHTEYKKKVGEKLSENAPDYIEKSNIIMVGSTGVGKTAILKAIAKYLDVPFSITDCNSLTASGFVGCI